MPLTLPVLLSVVPLLKESIGILMQRTPPSLDGALPECYQRVSVSVCGGGHRPRISTVTSGVTVV